MSMWDYRDLLRIAREGLEVAARAAEREQAVHGIDALSEVELHPLLANSFSMAGLGVRREWPYPGVPEKRPKFAARARCDLVLTTAPGVDLLDPVAQLLETDKAAGTLFESLAGRATASTPVAPRPTCPATDAFWLEVKVVGQYTYTLGVPGPNRAYGSELTGSLNVDLAKISADPALRWAGLLLIFFTDEKETADHDLLVALHRSLDKGHSFSAPVAESFAIPDHIGNKVCTAVLVPR
jgi:hypothetical protein